MDSAEPGTGNPAGPPGHEDAGPRVSGWREPVSLGLLVFFITYSLWLSVVRVSNPTDGDYV